MGPNKPLKLCPLSATWTGGIGLKRGVKCTGSFSQLCLLLRVHFIMLYIKNQTEGSKSLNQVEEKEVKKVVEEAFDSDTAIQVPAGALFLFNVKGEVIVLLHLCEKVLGFSLETQEDDLCNRINK